MDDATRPAGSMLAGYFGGYEAQWHAMKAETRIAVPPNSVSEKAFDASGAARRIDSVGIVFDLEESAREILVRRQEKILSRARERDPALARYLRPLEPASLHGTVYLGGVGVPPERLRQVVEGLAARAREVTRSIPGIKTHLGIENRLGPWVVTNMWPASEEDLGRWKELQAGMGHLEFYPIYYIHVSLLVVSNAVEQEHKAVLDEVLESVRRESASEPAVPVSIDRLHVVYAPDFDHFQPAGDPLVLLSPEAYAAARNAGCERMARQLGLNSPQELDGQEFRDRLWTLRGWFPDYFWPHVDAMMAAVGAGAVDPRQLAELMQAEKLHAEVLGDAALPVIQVCGANARPRVGTLHTIMRAVEACGLPLAIIHQAEWPAGSAGLDLRLAFAHRDEARMSDVAQAIRLIPDVPPTTPLASESEPLSLVTKVPRGLGRLGDILQALDKYDPRIAVTLLLGHPHWEDYDWLDLDLVIPRARKEEVKSLVRFWASYRYTDAPVWVAEKGDMRQEE